MGIADFGGVAPLVTLLQPPVPPFAVALALSVASADVVGGVNQPDHASAVAATMGATTIRAAQYALSALTSLALVPDYQVLIGLEGGNESLVWLLAQCTHAVETLEQRPVGQEDQDPKEQDAKGQQLLEATGKEQQGRTWLVAQLAQARAVRYAATGLLALVSAHNSNKAALHDSGAVEATARLLLACTDPILVGQQGGGVAQPVSVGFVSSDNGARWRLLRAALLTLANLAPHSASVQAAIAREGGLGRIVQAGLLTLSARDLGHVEEDPADDFGQGQAVGNGAAGAAEVADVGGRDESRAIAAAIRTSAVLVVAHASAHEGNKALVAASGAIPVLMSLLAGVDSKDVPEVVIEGALLGLAYLSTRNESNKSKMMALMAQAAGRRRLLSLLRRKHSGSRVAALAAWVVANLCTFNDEHRDSLVQEGVMDPLVALLASSSTVTDTATADAAAKNQAAPSTFHIEDAQRYGAWAIANLTNGQPENQKVAADRSAIPRLVALLRDSANESVRLNAVLALAKLSALPANAALVIDEGGAHALAHLLDRPVRGQADRPVTAGEYGKINREQTFGQGAGQVRGQTPAPGQVQGSGQGQHALAGVNPVLLENVLLTLSQLAAGPVVRHKEEIAACGALVPLVAMLSAGLGPGGSSSTGSSSVRYYATLTLARLAEAGRNVKVIGALNAVAPLIRLLRSGSSSRPGSAASDIDAAVESAAGVGQQLHPLDPTAAAALSALAHLSADPDNTVAIAVDDGVTHAVALLAAVTTPTVGISGSAQQLDALVLLRNLSESEEVRVIVASEGALALLVQLFCSLGGSEELQEYCVQTMANLSELPPVSEALAQDVNSGALEKLVQLLRTGGSGGERANGTAMVEHSLHVLANACSQDASNGVSAAGGGASASTGLETKGAGGRLPTGMRRLSTIKPSDGARSAQGTVFKDSEHSKLSVRAKAKERVLSFGVFPPLCGLLRSQVEAVQQHAATLAAVLCRKSAVCCAEISGLGSLTSDRTHTATGSDSAGPMALVELLTSNDLRTIEHGAWALASLAEFEASAAAAARVGAAVACAQLLDTPTAGGRARGKAARCLTRLTKWEQKKRRQGLGLGLGDGAQTAQAPQGSVLAMAERGGLVPSIMQALRDGAGAMVMGAATDATTAQTGAKLQKNALGLLMQLAQTRPGCEAIGAMSQQNPQLSTAGVTQQSSWWPGRGLTVELNRLLRIVQARHVGVSVGGSLRDKVTASSGESAAKVQLYTLSLLLQLASYPSTCRHLFAAASNGRAPQSANGRGGSAGGRAASSAASGSSSSVLPELAMLAQSASEGVAQQALGVVKRLLVTSEECRCSADAIYALAPALIEIIRSSSGGHAGFMRHDAKQREQHGFTTHQQEAVACLNCMMHANPSREALRSVLAAHMPMGAHAQDLQMSWLWLDGTSAGSAAVAPPSSLVDDDAQGSDDSGTARMQLLVNVCVADGGRNGAVLHGALEDVFLQLESAPPGGHVLAAASEAVAVLCAGLDTNRHLRPSAGPDLFQESDSHSLSGGGLGTSGAAVRQQLHMVGATTQLLQQLAEPPPSFGKGSNHRSPRAGSSPRSRPRALSAGGGAWAGDAVRDGHLALTAPYLFKALLELSVLPEARRQIAENIVVISSALIAVLESVPLLSAAAHTTVAGDSRAGTAGGMKIGLGGGAGGGRLEAARLCEVLAKFEGMGVRASMSIMDVVKALEKLASSTSDDMERAAAKEALVWASAGTTETILGAIDAGPVAGQASVGESGADAIAAPASRLSAQNRAEGMQGTLGNEVASDVQHLRKLLLLSASSKGSGAPEGKLAATTANEAARRLVGRATDPSAVEAMASAGALPVFVGVVDCITKCWSTRDAAVTATGVDPKENTNTELMAALAGDSGQSLIASALATADAMCTSLKLREESVRVGMTGVALRALMLQSKNPTVLPTAAAAQGTSSGSLVEALLRLLGKLATVEASLNSFIEPSMDDPAISSATGTSPGHVRMVANLMMEPHHPVGVMRLSAELLATVCGGPSGTGARAVFKEVGAGAFISVLRAVDSVPAAISDVPIGTMQHKLRVQLAAALALERLLIPGRSGTAQAVREELLKLGGVSELVMLIDASEPDLASLPQTTRAPTFSVQHAAVSALAHLCTSEEAAVSVAGVAPPPPEGSVAEAMVAVAIESGLQPLVALFRCPEPSVVAQACRLTVELCKHSGVRELFLAEGGVVKMCALLEQKQPATRSKNPASGAAAQVRRYALAVLAELSRETAVQAEIGEDARAVAQCMRLVVQGAAILTKQALDGAGSDADPRGDAANVLLLLPNAARTVANLSWYEANKLRIGRAAASAATGDNTDDADLSGADQDDPARHVVALLELISCEQQLSTVSENAVLALANASTVPSVKALVIGHGGVHRLVGLLKNGGQQQPLSAWMLKCTVWCLAILCHKQPKACQMTVAAGGLLPLIGLCRLHVAAGGAGAGSAADADDHTTQTTQECAAWCLAAIALLPTSPADGSSAASSGAPMDAPRRMIEEGAIPTLLSLFSSRSSRVRSKACRALGNLFAAAGKPGSEARRLFDECNDHAPGMRMPGAGGMASLLQVLHHSAEDPDDTAAKNGLRVLCILCECEGKAAYLQRTMSAGLGIVLTFLLHPSPKVQAQCVSLVAMVAAAAAAGDSADGESVLEMIVQQGGAPALLQLLRSTESADVATTNNATTDPPTSRTARTAERAVACLAHLSAVESNKVPLTRAGVIAPLLGLLRRAALQIRSRTTARRGQSQQPQQPPLHVNAAVSAAELEQIQEYATRVLANLTTASGGTSSTAPAVGEIDPQAQAASRCIAITDEGAVPLLVGFLADDSGTAGGATKRNALFALVNLAAQQRAKSRIAEAGAVPPLVNVLQTSAGDNGSSDYMRQYALLALACLSSEQEVQHEMVAEGVIPTLVELLRDRADESTRANAAWAVANLASDAQHRSQLMAAGAMKVLKTMGQVQAPSTTTPGQLEDTRPSTATRRLAKFAPMALDLMSGGGGA
jgi:hypothetical protein